MTAYVHIGTPKTGTTTIQNFCEINRLLLLEQGYLYSESVDKVKKRHSLIEDVVNEIYRNSAKIDLIEKIVKFKKQYLVLKQEILANQNKFFLFSSEAISGTFNNIVQIEILKKIMNNLGFNTIYIVVYIRNIKDFVISMASQSIKSGYLSPCEANPSNYFRKHIFDYRWICQNYAKVFGKEKLIVRLFDVDEFYHRDLIKDFIYSVGLKWNDNFIIPGKINESLNLIGFELQSRLNKLGCGGWNREKENNTLRFAEKYFQNFDDPGLKFQPCEKILQDYIDYFQDSNEWVRKNFFPFKAELFAKQNFIGYKENDILQNIKPLYWDSIANFVAEIINDKSKKIKQKNNKITDLSEAKNKLKVLIEQKNNKITDLSEAKNKLKVLIEQKNNKITDLSEAKNKLKVLIEQKNNKITDLSEAKNKLKVLIEQKNNKITDFIFQTKYGTAKTRIQNQLSYKLGQAMIVNSKSILGYLIMPIVLLSIIISHKQEQKIYQEKIKKDPSLKLPPLEDYPDYQEALKEKECLTYKLGEALIKANKTWYKGGYVKMLFEVRKLKRER